MDFSMKFFVMATVFLSVAQVIFALCPYAPTPTTTYCTGPAPSTPAKWDACEKEGTFKSISYCYLGIRGYVARYDYYTCAKQSNGGWFMAKYCCTNKPQTKTTHPAGFPDVFNYFNPATGKCDLTAPTQPPAITTTTTTAAPTAPPTTASSCSDDVAEDLSSSNGSIAYTLKNVGANLCVDATTRLSYKTLFSLSKCPKESEMNLICSTEELRRPNLLLMETTTTSLTIGAAFKETLDNDTLGRTGLTCAYTGLSGAQSIWVGADFCGNYGNPYHRFDLELVGSRSKQADGEMSTFFIRHLKTQRCLKPEGTTEGSQVFAFLDCDPNDPTFLWEREIWPISQTVESELSQMERSDG